MTGRSRNAIPRQVSLYAHGRAWVAALFCSMLSAHAANDAAASPGPFQPHAAVDTRNRLDVWALRRDVIALEALQPTADEDFCYPEHEDGNVSPRQLERERKLGDECAARARREAKRFKEGKAAFNRAWLPKFKQAIAGGDVVAETIFLLCDTTELLDRGDAVSTCHASRADGAMRRLQDIDFEPAYKPCDHTAPAWRRAFVFCTGQYGNWPTDSFRTLSLNRPRALTPGYLTWGRELHYGGSPSIYTGRTQFWPSWQLQDDTDAAVEKLLKQEPRWGVFLLRRVGRHEWVPYGAVSDTGRLDAA